MIEQAPYYCGDCPTPCFCLEADRCLKEKRPTAEGSDLPEGAQHKWFLLDSNQRSPGFNRKLYQLS